MKKGEFFRFKRGMTAYLIPIRYWEDEYPIKTLTVIESCGIDDKTVLAKDADEECPMIYGIPNRIYYRRENAIKARALLTQLHELENEDGAQVWADILLND